VHELSIALSIIEGAEEEILRQGGGRVCAVHIKLGPLSGVAKEALLFSYDLACQATALEGSRLVIEDVPVRIYCLACHAACDPVAPYRLQCSTCGAPASHVERGTELELVALELEA
jgi:hydrogenase nickel incorporation protein HypA/HybF